MVAPLIPQQSTPVNAPILFLKLDLMAWLAYEATVDIGFEGGAVPDYMIILLHKTFIAMEKGKKRIIYFNNGSLNSAPWLYPAMAC